MNRLAKARIAYEVTAKFMVDVLDADEGQCLHDEHRGLADAIRELERRRREQEKESQSG